jgi:transcriptional regulator with XRE-family HTH domain
MRQEAGMTQAELAAALGVGQATLSSWETGRYRPAVAVLARVAAAAQAGERAHAA